MLEASHAPAKRTHARRGHSLLVGAAIALGFAAPAAVLAQAGNRIEAPPGLPNVPTTKILAIGSYTAKATTAGLKPLLPSEVRETARLYLAGKLDQWYFKPEDNAVVFILNVTDIQEAHAMLERLPLGQAGLMQFQLIKLAPLAPLGVLMAAPAP